MHYISKAENWVIDLYPKSNSENYKVSDYLISIPYNDGYLLFHTLTWSMYFLSQEECNNIFTNKLLIKNKVIVNDDIDENELAYKIYINRSVSKRAPYKFVNGYVILTTNECNARCFYCYESEKKGSMTTETADKLIQFIKTHKNNNCNITWFGGEPLKNIPIIDYISSKLKEENIDFTSSMISNTLLFTPDLLEKAINLWNLTKLQMTLDGPEKLYNEIKNYKDFDGNPFETVINNINYILQNSDIKIGIRLSNCHKNIDYMEELINYLKTNLVNDKGSYYIYMAMLHQIQTDLSLLSKDNFEEKFLNIKENNFPESQSNYIKKDCLAHCMADNYRTIAVAPNGDLHFCEHVSPLNKIGDLDNGINIQENIKIISERENSTKFCRDTTCKLLPICTNKHYCPPCPKCTNLDEISHEATLFIRKLKLTGDLYFQKLAEINEKKGEE